MYRLIIGLFIMASPSTFALEIDYSFGLRQYFFSGQGELWKMKAPGMRLSVPKKDCNLPLLKSFEDRLLLKVGQIPHTKIDEKKVKKKQRFQKISYRLEKEGPLFQADPKSMLGQVLLKLPQDFVTLKYQAEQACKTPLKK